MRLFVLVRHGQSELNLTHHVNGDPRCARRTDGAGQGRGRRALHLQLAGLGLDLCIHTRFGRTRATAEIVLGGRPVPLEEEPLFDDIYVGELRARQSPSTEPGRRSTRARTPFLVARASTTLHGGTHQA